MTRGDQRNRDRDKAAKKKAGKGIQANNKVGKPKKAGDGSTAKLRYIISF